MDAAAAMKSPELMFEVLLKTGGMFGAEATPELWKRVAGNLLSLLTAAVSAEELELVGV
jgi:hypothetical protein